MASPTIVQVVGPPGAGKTTLIEGVLRSNRSLAIAVVRVLDDDTVAAPARDVAGNAETERYEAAGAYDVDLVRVPPLRCDVPDSLDASGAEFYGADAIVVEGGPASRRSVDAVVFVLRELGEGETLTIEETREVGHLDGRDALHLMLGLQPPESYDELEDFDEDDDDVEVIDTFEIPDEVAEHILHVLEHGHTFTTVVTDLRPPYAGLAEASLAVVNVGGGEAGAAPGTTRDVASDEAVRRTVDAIEALRHDEALHRTLHLYRSDVGPRTTLVARLDDASDAGTRKAVEAMKRRVRR